MVSIERHDPRVCHVLHQAVEIIGKRWTGAIVAALLMQPRRFSEFKTAIPDVSDRLLTERLKELEELGIVAREVATGRPVQVTYRLTPKGEALSPILDAISAWAHQWTDLGEAGTVAP